MRKKKLREMEEIASSIKDLAVPGMDSLIDAVKQRHPKASKKEIARAAFLRVILSARFARTKGGRFTTSRWKRATCQMMKANRGVARYLPTSGAKQCGISLRGRFRNPLKNDSFRVGTNHSHASLSRSVVIRSKRHGLRTACTVEGLHKIR